MLQRGRLATERTEILKKRWFGAKLEFLGETFKTDLRDPLDVILCSGLSTHGFENTAPRLTASTLACSWSLPALALSPTASQILANAAKI